MALRRLGEEGHGGEETMAVSGGEEEEWRGESLGRRKCDKQEKSQ